jgi:hypothetical protein
LLKFCAMIFFGQHVADANAAQNLLWITAEKMFLDLHILWTQK